MVRVAITGATGLVGECLLRLLLEHPEVEVAFLGSESSAGRDIADVLPALKGEVSRVCAPADPEAIAAAAEAGDDIVSEPAGDAVADVSAEAEEGASESSEDSEIESVGAEDAHSHTANSSAISSTGGMVSASACCTCGRARSVSVGARGGVAATERFASAATGGAIAFIKPPPVS